MMEPSDSPVGPHVVRAAKLQAEAQESRVLLLLKKSASGGLSPKGIQQWTRWPSDSVESVLARLVASGRAELQDGQYVALDAGPG